MTALLDVLEEACTLRRGEVSRRPFVGLVPFDEDAAELFSGRTREVQQALANARPAEAARFATSFAALEADLLALDAALARAAARLGDTPLLFSHPVYQYLERRYELNGRSLHWEPDTLPSQAMWRELDALLAQHPARVMIWEGEPLPETARELEARGLRSIVFSPAGNRPEAGDFLGVMQGNAARLGEAAAP